MFDQILVALGIKKVPFIAGFIGALISLKFFPTATWWEKVLTFFGGWSAAVYGTPMVIAYFKLSAEADSYAGGIGLVIGLFAMTIVAALITAITETKWSELISNILKKKATGE